MAKERKNDEVYSITSAAESGSSRSLSREKRYAIAMAIRTGCFIGAVIASGPLRWFLIAGAIFLPYVAVVLANAPTRLPGDGPSPFGIDRQEINPSGPTELGQDRS